MFAVGILLLSSLDASSAAEGWDGAHEAVEERRGDSVCWGGGDGADRCSGEPGTVLFSALHTLENYSEPQELLFVSLVI